MPFFHTTLSYLIKKKKNIRYAIIGVFFPAFFNIF